MSNSRTVALVILAVLLPLAACEDVLTLDVEAPGRIADEDLNTFDTKKSYKLIELVH